MAPHAPTLQFILFGDSLTMWAFDEENGGFGWFLGSQYGGKVVIRNEGKAGYTSTDLIPDFARIIAHATAPDAPRTLLVTIFLGANDAAFVDNEESVPLPAFEANIRDFVDTILAQPAMSDAKIMLITPPPVNILAPFRDGAGEDAFGRLNEIERGLRPYKTYMSKKRYAERVMQIAEEYRGEGRVVGVDFWGDLVRARLREVGAEFDEERLPGSGLYGVEDFGEGFFTDGLHLGRKGYEVLSRGLFAKLVPTWPQLAPSGDL